MQKVLILCVLAGCSSYPVVRWPTDQAGPAPDLVPIAEVLGPEGVISDAEGAALAARAAALKARVARGP
jgi:hypothetical protein